MERSAQVAAPAALALFVVVGVALSSRPLAVALGAAVVAVAAAVILAANATTGWWLCAGALVPGVAVTVICSADSTNAGWFAICVLAGWCALFAPTVPALMLGGVLSLGFVGQWLLVTDEAGWAVWISGTVVTSIACLLGRRERLLLEQLREAQAGLADRARTEERIRIARELHDVIGHALTVSLLHLSSARLALEEEPEAAKASLADAERLAQQSLAEVRAAVGLMRQSSSETAPMPGTGDLDELVESLRRAGTPVTWQVTGEPATLTATVGLTIYRILQEALTNTARHAPGTHTSVLISVTTEGTTLVVESAGAPGRASVDGTGLIGMKERAEAVGGRLTAGPWQGGWRVEAMIPT
jgi:signal transduction histidine kinase